MTVDPATHPTSLSRFDGRVRGTALPSAPNTPPFSHLRTHKHTHTRTHGGIFSFQRRERAIIFQETSVGDGELIEKSCPPSTRSIYLRIVLPPPLHPLHSTFAPRSTGCFFARQKSYVPEKNGSKVHGVMLCSQWHLEAMFPVNLISKQRTLHLERAYRSTPSRAQKVSILIATNPYVGTAL